MFITVNVLELASALNGSAERAVQRYSEVSTELFEPKIAKKLAERPALLDSKLAGARP